MRTHALSAVVCAALLAAMALPAARPALADEYRAGQFRFGQRALGTGGAVIAAPGDAEALAYNPASLAGLGASSISGAFTFVGDGRVTLEQGLRARDYAPVDQRSLSFLARPTSSVLAHPFGPRHSVAFSTLLVRETDEFFRSDIFVEDTVDAQPHDVRFYAARRHREREVHFGPTWAVDTGAVALGLSLFYARTDRDATLSSGFVEHFETAGGGVQTSFFDSATTTRTADGALLARIGLLVAAGDRLSIGLAATSPSLRLHGQGRISYLFAFSGNPASPDPSRQVPTHFDLSRGGIRSRALAPAQLGLGLAWQAARVRTELDGTLRLPLRTSRMALDAGQLDLVRNHYTNIIDHRLMPNAALGLEADVSARVRVRAGAFTDLSAAPPIPAQPDAIFAPRVHRFGGTASAAWRTRFATLQLGAEYSAGRGHDVVLRDVSAVWAPEFVRVRRDERTVLFFVSGALELAQSAAVDLLDGRER
jgi:hypothetical protein